MADGDRGEILGVCIVYCEDGELQQQWINIHTVHAIAWGSGRIAERPGNPSHGNTKIPPGQEPERCPPAGATGAGVCWWTGNAWVCGEA